MAYDDVPAGGLGVLVDSCGLVSVVAARASAAADLGLVAGASVVLTVGANSDRSATSVHLGDRPVSHAPGEA